VPAGPGESVAIKVEDAEIVMRFAHTPGAKRGIGTRLIEKGQHSQESALDLIEPACRPVGPHRLSETLSETVLIEYPFSFLDPNRILAVPDGVGIATLYPLD
jgi:hypothetical protein